MSRTTPIYVCFLFFDSLCIKFSPVSPFYSSKFMHYFLFCHLVHNRMLQPLCTFSHFSTLCIIYSSDCSNGGDKQILIYTSLRASIIIINPTINGSSITNTIVSLLSSSFFVGFGFIVVS